MFDLQVSPIPIADKNDYFRLRHNIPLQESQTQSLIETGLLSFSALFNSKLDFCSSVVVVEYHFSAYFVVKDKTEREIPERNPCEMTMSSYCNNNSVV